VRPAARAGNASVAVWVAAVWRSRAYLGFRRKALVRRFLDETHDKRNLAVGDDLLTADCVFYAPPILQANTPHRASLPLNPIRSYPPIAQLDNAPRELCRVGRAFRGDLGRRATGEDTQLSKERGRHAVWEHAALPRMMRTMILEPACGTGPMVASSCAGSTALESSGTALFLLPDRQAGLHRPTEAGLPVLDLHGRDDADEAEQPEEDPANDGNRDGRDDGAGEALDLHAGHEPIGEQQHHGRDDQTDDRTQKASADGDAQEAEQPYDNGGDHGDRESCDDGSSKATDREPQLQP